MLLRAVRSVLEQTYQQFELIVVDDGSSVSLEQARLEVQDHGHRWITQAPQGVSAARNRGVEECKYDWIALLDSDDAWKPTKLEEQVRFHVENPDISISQCEEEWYRHGVRVNQRAIHKMPSGDAFSKSLKLCCISPSAVLLKKDLVLRLGGFDEQMAVCEDYDLWLRITALHPVGLIEQPLVQKFGGHDDQLSKSQPAIDRFRVYAIAKLLRGEGLTDAQIALAKNEVMRKLAVLSRGAKKHAPSDFERYEKISDALTQGDYLSGFNHSKGLLGMR